MKKIALKGSMALGALVLAGTLTACSDRAETKAEDAARDAGRAAENTAEAAGDAARDAGDAVVDTTKDAARGVEGALENAGRAGDAAMETLDVKTALMADTRVDASDINVDTDHVRKVVVLRGKVPTVAQKTLAGEIATAKAVGYRVENNLAIGS